MPAMPCRHARPSRPAAGCSPTMPSSVATKAPQGKTALVGAVDKVPHASKLFVDLGWPYDEFKPMRTERPDRLHKSLQDYQACPETVKEISKIIAEVGLGNFEAHPNKI